MSRSPVRPLSFVLAASDHGPLIVSRFDYCQVPGGVFGVGAQVLGQGSYDWDEVELIRHELELIRGTKKGQVITALDCGANIGVMTIEMGRFMTGWGEVRAYEAQERLYYALCGNIALNNLFNVRAYRYALGKEVGCISAPEPNYLQPGSFGSFELRFTPNTEFIGQTINYSRDLVQIPAMTLDLHNPPWVDFIKLDVEGMELEVLEGGEALIQRCHPVMLIEWVKVGEVKLLDWLTTHGYCDCKKLGGNILAHFNS